MTSTPPKQPYLRWSDRFTVGVESLDADHRAIVELINDACAAWAEKKRGELKQLLVGLLELADAHFEREELVLSELPGYRSLKEHASEHRNRLAHLQRILDGFNDGSAEDAKASLPDTLVDWFIKQSIGHDAAIKAYFDDRTVSRGQA